MFMLKWLKRKKDIPIPPIKPPRIILKHKFQLIIHFKNKKTESIESFSKTMPHDFRKVLNWYQNRSSQMYTYTYDYGALVFDRDNILYIDAYKLQ